MRIDENEFFRQATLLILGSLDINKALKRCHHYLNKFMPVYSIHFSIVEPDFSAIQLISHSVLNEDIVPRAKFFLSEEAKGQYKNESAQLKTVFIINDPKMHPVALNSLDLLGKRDLSFMVMHLEIEGKRITELVLQAEGKNRYNKSHARLLSLLNQPFAIAISNNLRHREVLKLKDMQADQITYLHHELLRSSGDEIIGIEGGLKTVMEKVSQVAPLNTPVLLTGETGVGKEVVANAIHYSSKRSSGPFIKINCGAIPENLIDSELFGHEKGAFTGAFSKKRGLFELANQGTIFLDEIGELPLPAQTRFLRVLQNHEIKRVGGIVDIPVNIRIIVATNRNLEEMVISEKFRRDLFFRLNVFPIEIPPLRERREDISALIYHFLARKSKEMKVQNIPSVSSKAIEILKSYHWPGNVRELENMVERALIRHVGCHGSGALILPDLRFSGSFEIGETANQQLPVTCDNIKYRSHLFKENPCLPDHGHRIKTLDEALYEHIQSALNFAKGKITGPGGAADILAVNPNTLRGKMDKLGIPYKRKKSNGDQYQPEI
ncbi:conserved hypothetical protein [uncultured Desulfobacterium sp.]|uniref:Sigma-54 factor interaction domain-containing protein n=1 Tax=uncultured Desulfobacterium sp. TaxID=201089 RepID=A0A445MXD7_9BACT|nr:conserved hypothetical protein [uncultured Desulfobacterium sp.]